MCAFPRRTAIIQSNQKVCQFLSAKCTHSRALSIRYFQCNSRAERAEGAGVIGSVVVSQGVAPGDFIPRSRDTYKIGSQSCQLADVGNIRHLRDQLVHDGQGRNRRINRRYRGRNQDCLVLSSRAPLGRGALGPTPVMMTSAIRFGRHPQTRL
jgi:hypothetical protein